MDDAPTTPPADGPDPPRPTGVEAAKVHLTLVVVLTLCALAFWFELGRALDGNGLSWAYVFEWPLFAGFGMYMWWTVLHGGRAGRRRSSRTPTPAKPLDPKYEGMLAAWEAHQRELQATQAEAEGRDVSGPPPRTA